MTLRSDVAANHYARKFLGGLRDEFCRIESTAFLCLGGLEGNICVRWSRAWETSGCVGLVEHCGNCLSVVEPWFDYGVHFLPDYRSLRPRITLAFKAPCVVESLLSRSVPKLNLGDAVHILRTGVCHCKLEDRGCGMLRELAVKEGLLGEYSARAYKRAEGHEFDSLEEQISGRTWENVFNLD